MRKILMIFFCVPFMFSCVEVDLLDSSELNPAIEAVDTVTTVHSSSDGAGFYSFLGFGYDATKTYFNGSKNTRRMVVDVNRIACSNPCRITINKSQGQFSNYEVGTTCTDLLKSLSSDFDVHVNYRDASYGCKFEGEIESSYGSSKLISTRNSYAFYERLFLKKSITLNYTVDSLVNYLTTNFKEDIAVLTGDQIVSLYGTHVLTSIKIGGKVKINYKSTVLSSNKTETVTAGLSASIAKVISGISANIISSSSLAENNSKEYLHFKLIGGDSLLHVEEAYDMSKISNPMINLSSWISTIDENPVLIGSGEILIPIYEFITDPQKKIEVRNSFNSYFETSRIYDVDPLYHYHKTNGHHFFTTDWTELGNGMSGWNYEGVSCFVLPVESTFGTSGIPLYRYYKPNTGDHYLTTNWGELGNGASGYRFEKVQCNVLPNQLQGSVPLYRYWSNNKHDHFYTLSKRDYNDYAYECIVGYVFDPSGVN
ncbi:MAG: MAC/perforin domain-containing protein [Bacteroidales bacterium]|nr:MAC/perforin domain-containing protein [Bacteroidales bacterium]MDD4769945.1 MAC/perforin domain-containing protein [Bacteroidales bacterium]